MLAWFDRGWDWLVQQIDSGGAIATVSIFCIFLAIFVWRSLRLTSLRESERYGKPQVFDPLETVQFARDRSFVFPIRWWLLATGTSPRILNYCSYGEKVIRFIISSLIFVTVSIAMASSATFTYGVIKANGISGDLKILVMLIGILLYCLIIYSFDLIIASSPKPSRSMIWIRFAFSIVVSFAMSAELTTAMFKQTAIRSFSENLHKDYAEDISFQEGRLRDVQERMTKIEESNNSEIKNNQEKLSALTSSQLGVLAEKSAVSELYNCYDLAYNGEKEGATKGNCRTVLEQFQIKYPNAIVGNFIKQYDLISKEFNGRAAVSFKSGYTTGVKSDPKGGISNRAEEFFRGIREYFISRDKALSEQLGSISSQIELHKVRATPKFDENLKTEAASISDLLKSMKEEKNQKLKELDNDKLAQHKYLIEEVLFKFSHDTVYAWSIIVIIFLADMSVILAKTAFLDSHKYDDLRKIYDDSLHEWASRNITSHLPKVDIATRYGTLSNEEMEEKQKLERSIWRDLQKLKDFDWKI